MRKSSSVSFEIFFTLFSVVTHSGMMGGGHYLAYIRPNPAEGTWYKFDDNHVTVASLHEVLEDNYGGKVRPGSPSSHFRSSYMDYDRRVGAYMVVYVRESDMDSILPGTEPIDFERLYEEEQKYLQEAEEAEQRAYEEALRLAEYRRRHAEEERQRRELQRKEWEERRRLQQESEEPVEVYVPPKKTLEEWYLEVAQDIGCFYTTYLKYNQQPSPWKEGERFRCLTNLNRIRHQIPRDTRHPNKYQDFAAFFNLFKDPQFAARLIIDMNEYEQQMLFYTNALSPYIRFQLEEFKHQKSLKGRFEKFAIKMVNHYSKTDADEDIRW